MFDDTARRDASDGDARHPARVAALLEAAAAPAEPGPMKGEAEALAAFVASRNAPRRAPVRSTVVTARLAVAAALSGVLLTGGVGAAAASGVLPGAAQDTASHWLSKVGVTVPKAGHRPVHDGDSGTGDSGTGDAVAGDDAGADDDQGQGEVVSEAARDDETSGRGKGATVSELASDGRSRADEHGEAWGDRGWRSADEDDWRHGSESDEDDWRHGWESREDDRGQRASRSHWRERSGRSGRLFGRHDSDPGDEAATDADDTDRDDATWVTGDDEADGTDGGRPAAGSGESP